MKDLQCVGLGSVCGNSYCVDCEFKSLCIPQAQFTCNMGLYNRFTERVFVCACSHKMGKNCFLDFSSKNFARTAWVWCQWVMEDPDEMDKNYWQLIGIG